MASGFLIGLNLKKAIGFWGENLEIVGYLDHSLSNRSRTEIVGRLKTMEHVRKVDYVSEERSFNEFVSQSASLLPGLQLDQDMLSIAPASIVITLQDAANPNENLENIAHLASEIEKIEGIQEVSYSSDIIQKFSSLTTVTAVVLYIMGFILAISSILIISNSVHASISHRREEIEILELIGATPWMIRKPFLQEAGAIGIIAGVVALTICKFIFAKVTKIFSTQITMVRISENIDFFSTGDCLMFLLIAAGIGTLAAFLCLNAINNNWAAAKRTV